MFLVLEADANKQKNSLNSAQLLEGSWEPLDKILSSNNK